MGLSVLEGGVAEIGAQAYQGSPTTSLVSFKSADGRSARAANQRSTRSGIQNHGTAPIGGLLEK